MKCVRKEEAKAINIFGILYVIKELYPWKNINEMIIK